MPVYVRGYGFTKVGEHWDKNLEDLAVEACLNAIDMAGLSPSSIDKIYVSNALAQILNRKGHLGALIADALGIIGKTAIRIEAAGASGGMAVHQAFMELKGGTAKNILVCGVEKMTDTLPQGIYTARAIMEDWPYLTGIGATFEAIEALLLRMYLERYDAPHENIMNMAVISHKNAVGAKHAQFPRALSIETIKKSPYVADPLHLFEITAPADGAAAVVLSSETGDVEIVASSVCSDKFRFFEREDPLWLDSVYLASQNAYNEAKITHTEVDFLEISDFSTIMGVLEIEALGFAEKGAGHEFVGKGIGLLNSEKPINTFGGLKARGDPIGASGVYQIAEVASQLLGMAGGNQLDNVKTGLALSVGGIGAVSVVHIIRRR